MRCKDIEDSFRKCGIFPYDNLILKNCTADISCDEATSIVCAIPDLAKILLKKGKIHDDDFDRFGIRNNELYSSYIPRRRGKIRTNVEAFQIDAAKLAAKRLADSIRTAQTPRKRAANATEKSATTKKRSRTTSNEPIECRKTGVKDSSTCGQCGSLYSNSSQ